MNSAHVDKLRPEELRASAGSQPGCHLTLVTPGDLPLNLNTCEAFKDCSRLTQVPWAGCSCYLRVLHVLLESCTLLIPYFIHARQPSHIYPKHKHAQ